METERKGGLSKDEVQQLFIAIDPGPFLGFGLYFGLLTAICFGLTEKLSS